MRSWRKRRRKWNKENDEKGRRGGEVTKRKRTRGGKRRGGDSGGGVGVQRRRRWRGSNCVDQTFPPNSTEICPVLRSSSVEAGDRPEWLPERLLKLFQAADQLRRRGSHGPRRHAELSTGSIT